MNGIDREVTIPGELPAFVQIMSNSCEIWATASH
jgi:hypothetical protein